MYYETMTTENQRTENQRFRKGMHPNSLKNLKPFPKGVSGHPGRTMKNRSLTSLLKEAGEVVPKIDSNKEQKTWQQLCAELAWPVAYKQLLKGDHRLYQFISERIEGKPVQPISGEGGDAIPVQVIYEKVTNADIKHQD